MINLLNIFRKKPSLKSQAYDRTDYIWMGINSMTKEQEEQAYKKTAKIILELYDYDEQKLEQDGFLFLKKYQ